MEKVYHLNKTMKLVLGSLMAVWTLFFVFIAFYVTDLEELVIFLLCFFPLPTYFILVILNDRIIVSPDGILSHSNFPFKTKISWDQCKRIVKSPVGFTSLYYLSNSKEKLLPLYQYIQSWDDNQLLQEIQKYAPHVTMPEEIHTTIDLSFQYRAGIILMYYVFLGVLMVFGTMVPIEFNETMSIVSEFAFMGWLGGIFGGGFGLLNYAKWLQSNRSPADIKRMAIKHYLAPFSALLMGAFIGFFYTRLVGQKKLDNPDEFILKLTTFVGFFQLNILNFMQKIFDWLADETY